MRSPPRVFQKGTRRTSLAPLAAVALGLVLAACGSDEPLRTMVCPEPIVVQDASRLVKFDGTGRDLTDVLFEAELQDIAMVCRFDRDEHRIDATLGVRFFTQRGPADTERTALIRYFVAIATGGRNVVAREEFGIAIPFEGNRTRVLAAEELEPTIPLRPDQSGSEFRVYVGFVLSPEELEYNRQNR